MTRPERAADRPGRAFRPSFRAILAAVTALALLIGLGTWQLQRLEWKRTLIANLEARTTAAPVAWTGRPEDPGNEFARVRIVGAFDHGAEMHLNAQPRDGRPGVDLVTPLRIGTGAEVVLVNRGWIPLALRDPAPGSDIRPAGPVELEGFVRHFRPKGLFTPENDPAANQWYYMDRQQMGEVAGIVPSAAYLVAAPSEEPDALPIGRIPGADLSNNHLGYALTWFGLALVLVVIFVIYHLEPQAPNKGASVRGTRA